MAVKDTLVIGWGIRDISASRRRHHVLMDITTLVSVCTREDALVLAVIARDRAADRVPLEVPATAIASGPAAARKAANQAGLAVRKLAVRKLLRPRPRAARWLMDITTLVSVCTREDALVLAVIARDRAADRVPLEVPAMAIASGPAAARKAANQAGLAVRKLLRPRRH